MRVAEWESGLSFAHSRGRCDVGVVKLVVSAVVSSFLLFVVLLVASPSAFAQTAATGQIVGTVTDPAKASVADAAVTVKNVSTGLERTARTGPEGEYVVPLLPPGNYTVTVSANGFKTQTSTQIVVEVATTATVNLRLQLGGSTESIVVE